MENVPVTSYDIAPDGDIVLVVGESRMRLRVQSLFLKSASPVFKALLSVNFLEAPGSHGRQPNSALIDIPLPADDADALKVICCIVHFKSAMIGNLNHGQVLSIARAADKYDCVESLQFASHKWMEPIPNVFLNTLGDMTIESLVSYTHAAYLFKNGYAFTKLTALLVKSHCHATGTGFCRAIFTGGAPEETLYKELPKRVLDGLEIDRFRCREQLRTTVDEFVCQMVWDSEHFCTERSSYPENFSCANEHFIKKVGFLNEAQIYPVSAAISLNKIMEAMAKFCDTVPIECSESHEHMTLQSSQFWKADMDRVNKTVGLCLTCTLDNEDSGAQHSANCSQRCVAL